MSLDEFIMAVLTEERIKEVKDMEWPQIEPFVGRMYFGVANYFAPAEYEQVPTDPSHDNKYSTFALPRDGRPTGIDRVLYLAANHRGFYLRNGRETTLAPYQDLRERQPDLRVHYELHSAYLHHLSHRSESINQIFLTDSGLKIIEVHFGDEATSRLSVNGTASLEVKIGKDISFLWEEALVESKTIAQRYLSSKEDSLKDLLKLSLGKARDAVITNTDRSASKLLASPLFTFWARKPPTLYDNSLVNCVEQFRKWVLALAWLSFYCCEKHAGRHFYSVRLPRIVEDDQGRNDLPESSISVVSDEQLGEGIRNELQNLPENLLKHDRTIQLRKIIAKQWRKFIESRMHTREEGWKEKISLFLSHASKEDQKFLPIDFEKTEFLLRVSRALVGRKHEGAPLHFCFIFGFSSERIDSETRGCLTEEISGLNIQWDRFRQKVIDKAVERKFPGSSTNLLLQAKSKDVLPLMADGMHKWIMNGDLSLSPWDMALYFEEDQRFPWPVPTSLVKVRPLGASGETIATEVQLRQALVDLTKANPSVVAVIVLQMGMVVFSHGHPLLLPCSSKQDYNDVFSEVRLYGPDNKVDRELFEEFLREKMDLDSFANVQADEKDRACRAIAGICEALVSLGHGALLVVRAKSHVLPIVPPLNPMWQIHPNVNGPEFDRGIFLYSLLAALDGATEVVLPEGREPITFIVRKNALPTKMIWNYDDEGDATVADEFKDITDVLGLIGKGTRHHSALALSSDLGETAIVVTVSADGPVTLWINGQKASSSTRDYEPRLKP